jgi:hypothetical protein
MIRLLGFSIVLLAAFGYFAFSCRRILRILALGKNENRFDKPADRLKNVLLIVFGQTKLLREPLAGLMHFVIFWGFVVLLSAVLEAIVQGIIPTFTIEFLGPLLPPLAILQEALGALVILSCLMGLARWYWMPPKRYFGPEIDAHVRMDATLILCLIMTIMASMFGATATRMILSGEASNARFISGQFAGLFAGSPYVSVWYEFFWWTHIL